jgi:TonB family protein
MIARKSCIVAIVFGTAAAVTLGAKTSFADQDIYRPPSVRGSPHVCPSEKYYPPDLIQSCTQGTTYLSFDITVDGAPKDIRVDQSAGNAELDDAAKLCASGWRYNPPTRNGLPAELPWRVYVDWSLKARGCTPIARTPFVGPPIAPK